MRSLLIGERPPPRAELRNHSPLYPLPPRCAGARLHVLSGLSIGAYLACFDRVNLVPYPGEIEWSVGPWPREEARWCALSLVRGGSLRKRRVVLLGARVRDAFDVLLRLSVSPKLAEHARWYHDAYNDCHWGLLPHPSGRSRAWNDPELRAAARVFLREAAGVEEEVTS